MHTLYSDKRKSGIPLMGDIPWGTDFCQFYQSEDDLMEILIPYFMAGLDNNELCIWITSRSLDSATAEKMPEKVMRRFGAHVEEGQLEVIPQSRFHAQDEDFGKVIISKLDIAITKGFDGLRLAYDFPEDTDRMALPFEGIEVINRYNIIAVLSYPRNRVDAAALMETIKHHQFALVRSANGWEIIESSEVRTIRDALKRSEEKLSALFNNMSEGFAYHRIVLDPDGRPIDYVFHEVNEAFEKLTGLKGQEIIGRTATQVLPGIENDPTDWIERYGRVALTGEPIRFESFSETLGKHYAVSAFSPHKGYFAVTFSDITERSRMEQSLRESEEKLRVTLTSIGDAVISTDAASRITFINPVAARLTGWGAEEAQGRRIEEVFRIINEQTRKPADDIIRRVLRQGRAASLANHTSLITREGREIPIEDSAAPIMDKAGMVLGVVLVFHDVTEQRKAQQALRDSEAQVRTVLENLNQGVVVANLDGNLFYWNPAAVAMHGFGNMEECRHHLSELADTFELVTLEGKTLPLNQWPMSRILAGERLSNLEFHIRRLNTDWQRVFSYGGNLAYDAAGRPFLAVVTINDMTERKQMEEKLRRAKEEWELTFDTVPDLIAILDDQHRILRVNRAMADQLGVTPDRCIGRRCYEAVHGMHETPEFCPHSLTCRDGRQHVAEVAEPRLGGDFMVSTTPLRDSQGKVTGSVHVARDITARKQAEAELRRGRDELELRVQERTSELQISNKALLEYAAKLERLNEELRDFAFIASHDLQEPLRKIQTFCDMAIIERGSSLDNNSKEFMNRIVNSADRMRQLLRDLVQFSKAAAEPGTFKEIDLNITVREAADLFEESLKESDGRIEIQDIPKIEADEGQMLRLFQNLIANAVKFRGTQSPRIRIYAICEDAQCKIFVKDNGIGFDPQFAQRIFKPLQRLHGRNEYEGTGMGLAICHKIVESHGGTISADSEPGKGSTFGIILPMKQLGREGAL